MVSTRKGRPIGDFDVGKAKTLWVLGELSPYSGSNVDLSEVLGCSVRQVKRYLAELLEEELIKVSTSRYRLGKSWVNRRILTVKGLNGVQEGQE